MSAKRNQRRSREQPAEQARRLPIQRLYGDGSSDRQRDMQRFCDTYGTAAPPDSDDDE